MPLRAFLGRAGFFLVSFGLQGVIPTRTGVSGVARKGWETKITGEFFARLFDRVMEVVQTPDRLQNDLLRLVRNGQLAALDAVEPLARASHGAADLRHAESGSFSGRLDRAAHGRDGATNVRAIPGSRAYRLNLDD